MVLPCMCTRNYWKDSGRKTKQRRDAASEFWFIIEQSNNKLAVLYKELNRLASSIDTILYDVWYLLPDYLQRYLHSRQGQFSISEALCCMLLGVYRNCLKLLLLKSVSQVNPACLAVRAMLPTNPSNVNMNVPPSINLVHLPFWQEDWNLAVNQFTCGIKTVTPKSISTLVDSFVRSSLNQLDEQAPSNLIKL